MTLSGLNPAEIDAWDYPRSGLDGFYEFFAYEALDWLSTSRDDCIEGDKIVARARRFKSINDFATDEIDAQNKLYAAFVLVSLERLAQSAINDEDGWRAMNLLIEIFMCMTYISAEWKPVHRNAKRAATAKNLTERTRIIEKWKCDKSKYKNKTAFANYWSIELKKGGTNVSPRTIAERWLKNI